MSTTTGVIRALCSLKAGRYLREHRAVEVIRDAGVFDEEEYLARNPDVVESGLDPILHYIRHGAEEGRQAHPFFDENYYLQNNPDVANSGQVPLEHFVRYGAEEQRSPHPQFNVNAYLTKHAFCRINKLNPLTHLRLTTSLPTKKIITNPIVEVIRQTTSAETQSSRPSTNGQAHRPKTAADEISSDRRNAVLRTTANCTTLFSIIIPTWNRRALIAKALDSILAQSYQHYEILVADDGSTDGTHEFIASTYPNELATGRIRWIKGTHAGVSAARNRGLSAAQGEWIAYLDSDNVWRPDYLLFMAAEFIQHPGHRTAYAGMRVNRFHLNQQFDLCRPFDWPRLAAQNFIDLNVFCHHREVSDQLGGFDTDLRRLVDWELVVRYTRLYPPAFINLILADYFTYKDTDHSTTTEPLQENWDRVWARHHVDRLAHGSDELRLAYVLWDFPALSQTFVLAEIRELVARGIDVRVYYKEQPDEAARLDFPIEAEKFQDVEALTARLALHKRNWLHSHFAYPAVTLATYPAAQKLGLPFSFMPHAVDIFHHANRQRNQLQAITADPLCQQVICYGPHHREFLHTQGVPTSKIMMSSQAFQDLTTSNHETRTTIPQHRKQGRRAEAEAGRIRIVCIARFIEKKGIEYLIEAARQLDPQRFEIHLYGYGPLEKTYRKLIQKYRLKSFHLKGVFQGDAQRQEILAHADLFVLPCIEAANGDVDGFPTVFLEAMSAGLPVITTTVSANQDFIMDGVNGLLSPPRDAQALAETLQWCGQQPPAVLKRLAENARQLMTRKSGAREVVDTILDATARPPLDLLMVTWFPDAEQDFTRTLRIIQRVIELTTTPFILTIVDNGSGPKFLTALRDLVGEHDNIRIIETKADLGCGPASNIAFELARSEFMIYLCSNEAYVATPGWERPLLTYMRTHPDVALAGHLVSSPSWHTGRQYQEQTWFAKFRNQEYAQTHADDAFTHVQGGAYIFRRTAYLKHGGFNPQLPMQQCDVELSYYLQSCGCKLGDLSRILSVTQATRPTFHAMLDESVAVVHPVTCTADEELIDRCVTAECQRCNISGWIENTPRSSQNRPEIARGFINPQNSSTGISRALYRLIAASHWDHRNLKLAAWLTDRSLVDPLTRMFDVCEVSILENQPLPLQALPNSDRLTTPVDLAIIANLALNSLTEHQGLSQSTLKNLLTAHGSIVFSYQLDTRAPDPHYFKRLAQDWGLNCEIVHYESRVHGFGLAPLIIWTRK